MKTAWKKFKELLPVLSSCHLSFKTRGHMYSFCVRSAKLHASETWPLTKPNLQCLQRNNWAMIRQICNVKPQDIVTISSNELRAWLGNGDLNLILKERRLPWYGHVEHFNDAVKKACDIQVDGKHGPGRPKMTLKRLTERVCRGWKLSAVDTHDRHTWRSDVTHMWDLPCVQHASYLVGPTDVNVAPVPAGESEIWWWWWCFIEISVFNANSVWPWLYVYLNPCLAEPSQGRGGNNLGVILVRVCEPVFQNLPHSYTWTSKKRTHSYTWSSKMLTYSYTALWFFVPIFCWLLHKFHSQFM